MLKTFDTLKKILMQLLILLTHKFGLSHLPLPCKSHFKNLRDRDSILFTSLSPTLIWGSDYVHVYMLSHFTCVQLFAMLWTVAHHTSLSRCHDILQVRVLKWVAVPSCRGSFQPRDQTSISCVSYIGFWGGTSSLTILVFNKMKWINKLEDPYFLSVFLSSS